MEANMIQAATLACLTSNLQNLVNKLITSKASACLSQLSQHLLFQNMPKDFTHGTKPKKDASIEAPIYEFSMLCLYERTRILALLHLPKIQAT